MVPGGTLETLPVPETTTQSIVELLVAGAMTASQPTACAPELRPTIIAVADAVVIRRCRIRSRVRFIMSFPHSMERRCGAVRKSNSRSPTATAKCPRNPNRGRAHRRARRHRSAVPHARRLLAAEFSYINCGNVGADSAEALSHHPLGAGSIGTASQRLPVVRGADPASRAKIGGFAGIRMPI